MDLLARLGLEHAIVQAGMGGGVTTAELAAAVSRAGALGTVAATSARGLRAQVRRARELAPGRPLAVNLLLPFLQRDHVQACLAAGVEVVVLFFGFDRDLVARLHEAGTSVLHQVGTVGEVRRALADGAAGVVAQGLEAGGHLLATDPIARFLPQALAAAAGRPVLAAGGVASGDDVEELLAIGAAGVVAGTRFLLTEESGAHPRYKERVLAADRTLETRLFGIGWPARHRVVPNAATERWCSRDPAGPGWVRAAQRLTTPLRAHPRLGPKLLPLQRPGVPLFTPLPPVAGMDERLVEATPLYAGESALRIDSVVPASEAVRLLARRSPPPMSGAGA